MCREISCMQFLRIGIIYLHDRSALFFIGWFVWGSSLNRVLQVLGPHWGSLCSPALLKLLFRLLTLPAPCSSAPSLALLAALHDTWLPNQYCLISLVEVMQPECGLTFPSMLSWPSAFLAAIQRASLNRNQAQQGMLFCCGTNLTPWNHISKRG